MEGFATENKLMLLNLAARHMEPGEVYVEVGSWKGLSLIGAATGNEDRRFVACDDFSRVGLTRRPLDDNIRDHCAPGQVEVHAMDYCAFLRRAPWRPDRIGVYFYDGPHHYRHQVKALDLVRPWLAEDAIVVIDDTDDLPVRAANLLFRRRVPGFQPVLDIRSPGYKDPAWWNGIQVFRWRENGEPARLPVPPHVYLPRLLLWNRSVVYTQRLAHYARSAARRLSMLLP